jgi:ubiquinone/menaquinone biosynthesis C-methylase UbiE
MIILDYKKMFTQTYKGNKWGSSESRSGTGSDLAYTEWVRKLILELIDGGVKTIWDCSCGDWNWMKEIRESLPNYIGNDIVSELIDINVKKFGSNNIKFQSGDMLAELKKLESASIDLVICRHTLEHLPTNYTISVVKEIRRVSKMALITSNSDVKNLLIIPTGVNARAINLEMDEYFKILGYPKSKHYDSNGEQCDSSANLNLYEFKNNI